MIQIRSISLSSTSFLVVLTKFYPQKSIVKQKNLLKGGNHVEEEEEDEKAVQQEKSVPVQQEEVKILVIHVVIIEYLKELL